MHSALRAGIAGLLVAAWAAPAQGQAGAIAGSWHGTSICVDREHYPACKDEQVIYDARVVHTSPDSVAIRADKVVAGVREFMGEYVFTPQTDGSWASELQTPRVHLRVRLVMKGDRMTGTLTDLDAGRRVRDITLERAGTAGP